MTDNRVDRVVARTAAPKGWKVVVWIPPGTHLPSPDLADRFSTREIRERLSEAFELLRAGDLAAAVRVNSDAVEGALGLDYSVRRRAALEQGAVAVGVSGLGPALAAFSTEPNAHGVASAFDGLPGRVRTVDLSEGPATLRERR